LSVDRVTHSLSQDWSVGELRVQGAELEGQDRAASGLDARIFSWLTARRSSPAGLACADSSVASSTEGAVRRAVIVALGGHDVVRVQGLEETFSWAIRRRNSGRVLGDAKLSNAANEAAISFIRSP